MQMCRPLSAAVLIVLTVLVVPRGLASDDDENAEPAPRFHAKTLEGQQFDNASIKVKLSCWISGPLGANTVARKRRWWTDSEKNFPIKA